MKKTIARELLKIGAVSLRPTEPFTWASGLKSPIYCDNRLTLSFPELRREIAKGMQSLIEDYFPTVEIIAGTATAGIPHAAWVSERLNCPMAYVRSSAKGHGKGNQIEGRVARGQKVVVIEDLISTGGSVLTAVEALREAGCDVLGVVGIFTYELEKGRKLLQEANIPTYTLTDFTTLVGVASEEGYIQAVDIKALLEWNKDPANWGICGASN